MLIHIIFGMIVGAIFILYYLVTKPNSENNDDHQLSKGYKFYLNVIIQNKSQVVKKRVSEKVPHGLFGIGRKIAANVADAVVDDEKFAKKIGNSLTKQIPNKLKEKFGSGITVKTENVFLKDNLVVISVEIAKANIVQIIDMQPNGGKDKSSKLRKMFNLLGKVSKNLETIAESEINKKIAEKIGAKMKSLMAEEIKEKLLREGGVDVLIKARHSSHQAEFFFSLIHKMEAEKSD